MSVEGEGAVNGFSTYEGGLRLVESDNIVQYGSHGGYLSIYLRSSFESFLKKIIHSIFSVLTRSQITEC